MKWAGLGHAPILPRDGEESSEVKGTAGMLAIFCPSCPQPGVNLPSNWHDDQAQTAYTRLFVMDGNFSAIHQMRTNAGHDAPLTSGEFFMVERDRYEDHVKIAEESKQVRNTVIEHCQMIKIFGQKPTCNEHLVVNNRFRTYKGKDVTGIGATACARHGCYCPGAVVDFHKGER